MSKTLIVTLLINKDAEEFFTKLRDEHFPAAINYLKAHLTLFHNLPEEDYIYQTLEALCKQQTSFQLAVPELRSSGNGVVFRIESELLKQLHAQLQTRFKEVLIPQDRQRLWPHITIQNKVPAQQAHELLNTLNKDFKPFSIEAQGFVVWEYLNGPWSLQRTYYFKDIQ